MNHLSIATIAWAAITIPSAAQSIPPSLTPLSVHGLESGMFAPITSREIDREFLFANDGADLLRGIPGTSSIRNGLQTGIAQIRGLSGDRVRVTIDGRTITPACPNHMDPPLHYAQPAPGDRLDVFAGIAPVSAGGDSIAGVIRLTRPTPEFATNDNSILGGRIGGSFRSANNASGGSAAIHQASNNHRVEYRGSWLTADDLRFPGGRVSSSGFDTQRHDIITAFRTENGFIAFDTGASRTRDAGTPTLPMDMVRDDSWHFGNHHRDDLGGSGTILDTRFYIHDVDHLMDNFSLRPAPPMRMQAPATSRDYGFQTSIETPLGENRILVGIDTHRAEFNARQINPVGLSRDTFNDNTRTRLGAYVDLESPLADRWTLRTGIRPETVQTRAGIVSNTFGGPIVNADRDAFNAGPRSHRDAWLDAATALRFEPDKATTLELGIALKNRAPSLVERYLWTPANASAGLADGRTYLGNPNLDPEQSIQISLGATRRGDSWSATLTPFYQSVRDFIQGTPHPTLLDTSGRPVLQYQNLRRAELYGAEFAVDWDIHERLTFAANASYVRATNRETDEALYRVAPLRGLTSLAYRHQDWEASIECEWAAAQNRVATTQNEPTTPGYGLLHLRTARTFHNGIRIEAGIENIFNKRHTDHLGGINRVPGGDLALGQRIPGAGRSFYTAVNWSF